MCLRHRPMNPSPGWMSGASTRWRCWNRSGNNSGSIPLLLEDIANTDQRPKLDDYETYLFLVMKMLSVTERQDIVVEQVSFVLGRNFVLSFQENGTDVFHAVRERLRGGKGVCGKPAPTICSMRWSTRSWINTFAVLEVLARRSKRCKIWWSAILSRRRCGRFMRSNGSCCFCAAPCGRSGK